MASWHDGNVCSRIDLVEWEGLATCISCGSTRDHPYTYEPIKQRSEIRLLKIQPGEGDDPIRGELVTISTDSQHEYDAVSYTWADETGDATRRFRAFIGAGYVLITGSCQKVLQRIRSFSYAKCVWIDSLCVDQDNLEERGHQVYLMPRIYTRAKKTYVYVGPTTISDERSLEALETGRLNQGWSADVESSWIALYNFLRRPYFFRVWIIQEIALSPNPVILCGQKEFPWSVLPKDTAKLSLFGRLDQELEDRVVSPLLSLGKRRLRDCSELSGLLRLSRHCQATDHRDRVFALLGLVVDAEAEKLVADYRRSVPEIFTGIARYLTSKGTAADSLGNLNVWGGSAGSASLLKIRHQLQLPSWVPDWTNPGMTFLDRFPDEARTYLERLPLQLDKQDKRALILTGFEIESWKENLKLDQLGRAMLLQPLEPVPRFVLFQVAETERKTSSSCTQPLLSQFLMILLPVEENMDENLEVPGSEDFQHVGTYAEDQHSRYFRFLGLLQTHATNNFAQLHFASPGNSFTTLTIHLV